MEPISTTVASIMTGFLVKGAAAATASVGAAVTEAARTLAQSVLDRLRADPQETRTVERYEREPEKQQPAIEAAIAQLVESDQAFAAQLAQLVESYEQARLSSGGAGVEVGSVEGSVQVGDHGILVDRNTGTVHIGRTD